MHQKHAASFNGTLGIDPSANRLHAGRNGLAGCSLPCPAVHIPRSIHTCLYVDTIPRASPFGSASCSKSHLSWLAYSDERMAAAWTCRHHSTDDVTAGAGDKPAKSLFVVNIEGRRHNGPLLIGLMDYFERHLARVVRGQITSSRVYTMPSIDASS